MPPPPAVVTPRAGDAGRERATATGAVESGGNDLEVLRRRAVPGAPGNAPIERDTAPAVVGGQSQEVDVGEQLVADARQPEPASVTQRDRVRVELVLAALAEGGETVTN